MTMVQDWSRRAFLGAVQRAQGGELRVECPDGSAVSNEVRARSGGGHEREQVDPLRGTLKVLSPRFFARAVASGDIGIGESYMDGEWTSPDLVSVARLMLRNLRLVEQQGGLVRLINKTVGAVGRRLRDNSLSGSRKHIHRHYDLGNDFFRLFLDSHLMYSCAFYQSPHDALERAQEQKLDRICRKLDLGPDDHVLEIGTGWGGFALWAATRYGCRVTTTTISEEQFRYATGLVGSVGAAAPRIEVLRQDYRELTGTFDKVVSIEMFEAVGFKHYDDYFSAVDRLLKPDGTMLLQTITLDDRYFPEYQGTPDWIEKYIFPGGELASVGEITKSLARVSRMSLYHAENIGTHYARTLHAWRDRFHRQLDAVRALGFDERFVRMWDLYLAYCEAAFLERHAGVFQLLLTKNYSTATLFNEPWVRGEMDKATAVA